MLADEALGQNRSPSNGQPGLSLEDVWRRCRKQIEAAYAAGGPTLLDALPGMGKSRGAVEAAARTGEPVTILTGRGREEQYAQIGEWCDEYGLSWRQLPSAKEECPTLDNANTSDVAIEARRKYDRGATARELHDVLDLPCEEDEPCPYRQAWDFDASELDVLVGHYTHANVGKATGGRVVVLDEFPGESFISTVGPVAITQVLRDNEALPFEDFTNLIERRGFRKPRREALKWFEGRGLDIRDGRAVAEDESGEKHAMAPLATLTLLKARNLDNGWEHALLGGGQVGVHDRDNCEVHVLDPPDLSGAEGVVCLDGTPTKELWELAVGLGSLDHQEVLTDSERRAYVLETQDLQIVQTTGDVLPYSSGEYVNTRRDAALVHEITRMHGTTPGVITSQTALQDLEDEVEVADGSATYYGNFKGSNALAGQSVGVILGSPHYGDNYVDLWTAFAGESTPRERNPGESYGEFGDEVVLHHMREQEVLQATFRFAREGDGATVYVHTGALPEWVPTVAGPDGCTVRPRGPRERDVLEALSQRGSARASEIADGMDDRVTDRWVRKIGNRLAHEGVVRKQGDPTHAQASIYELTSDYNPYGQLQLTEVTEGNPEVTRIESLYGIVPGYERLPDEDRPWWEQEGWREELARLEDRRRRTRRQIDEEIWRNGEC